MGSDNVFWGEPPKDASGKVIPLDTEVLYTPDGQVLHVISIKYVTKNKWFETYGYFEGGLGFWEGCTDKLLLAPPDSWEKLEEDALKNPCRYFGMFEDQRASCTACPHGPLVTHRICGENMRLDLIERAKKLAGVEEQEGER